jgi:hypothetical protein
MTWYSVTFENLDTIARFVRSPHVIQVYAVSREEAVQKARKCAHDTDPSMKLGVVHEVVEVPDGSAPESIDVCFVNRGISG